MPRGVYNRKGKKKPRKASTVIKIWQALPAQTQERLLKYCKENNMDVVSFVKKAIYDKLPMKYEVDDQFVFPFGKYTGETVAQVKQFDAGYLAWCNRTIAGFSYRDITAEAAALKKAVAASSSFTGQTIQTGQLYQLLRIGERLKINRHSAWANTFIDDKWRKLATRHNPESNEWYLT